MPRDKISVTTDIEVMTIAVPNFIILAPTSNGGVGSGPANTIPVGAISQMAADRLAEQWLDDFYAKVDCRNPFTRPVTQ